MFGEGMEVLATRASIFASQDKWVLSSSASYGLRVSSNAYIRHSLGFCRHTAHRTRKILPLIRKGVNHICKASDKGDSDGEASAEGKGSSGETESVNDEVHIDTESLSSRNDNNVVTNENWRAFRARLVAREHSKNQGILPDGHDRDPEPLEKKWAHAIHSPETGCLLVATKKLDDYNPFKRSVVLLLRLGSNRHQDGPFGIILNKPILKITPGSQPITEAMDRVFQNRRLYFGGPLPADIFLLMPKVEGGHPFEEIMPGIYYGYYSDNLDLIPELSKENNVLEEFRFYMGYAGWDLDQLENEIAEGFWVVAACSPDLIKETSSDSLWEEVLTSMGGEYEEILKKLEDGT